MEGHDQAFQVTFLACLQTFTQQATHRVNLRLFPSGTSHQLPALGDPAISGVPHSRSLFMPLGAVQKRPVKVSFTQGFLNYKVDLITLGHFNSRG